MYLKTRTFLLVGLTVLFHSFISAQSYDDSLLTKELEEFVLQGTRLQIPFSEQNRDVVVLDAKLIRTLPVQSINELLNYVGGVDVRQRSPWGGQADISINGGTFEQTLILLNGVKIIDPQTGHNMMNLPIPLEIIEKIEILKGAAASVYGINALNGVINIITQQPNKTGGIFTASTGSSFEKDTSNGKLYGAIETSLSGSLKTKNTKHFLSLGTTQTSGHRYNTAMNNNKVFYQNQINLKGAHFLRFMAGAIHNEFGANGFYAAPGDVESKETIQTGIGALTGKFRIKDNWQIVPSVSYRYNKDDYVYIRQNPEVYRNIHTTNVFNGSINNSIQTSFGNFGVGLEYRNESINSNSLGKWNRDNYGLYAEFSLTKVKRLSLNIGSYLNYSEHFNFQVLPSLDVSYSFTDNWRIFANVGTGTRVPTYTDWYYIGPQNIGNSSLTPENAIHTEGGVKFNSTHLNFTANYFYRLTTDVIDWVKDSLNAPWQPHNFQEITLHGISFALDYRWFKSGSDKQLDLISGISYTWLDAKINSENKTFAFSRYALENLQHQLIIRTSFDFLKHFGVSVSGRYEKRINSADYFLLDARASFTWNELEVYFHLNNLGNKTFIEAGASPLPGRWFGIGLKYQLWQKNVKDLD